MKATPPVVEITEAKANEALAALQVAIDRGDQLAPQLRVAVAGLSSYLHVLELLARRGIGIKYLRTQLGITPSEDDQATAQTSANKKPKKEGKKGRHSHGRRGSDKFPKADHRYFAHPDFNEPGMSCPDCERGHVYPHAGRWHRFHGQPLLRVLLVNHEIWRCTLCQQSFPAPIAKDILADGPVRRPFGDSAIALIAIAKNFFGTPWSRQERMQKMLDLPIPASTLHDQTEIMAEALSPIYELLQKLSGNAWRFFSDDTGVRILKQTPITKEQRKTGKQTLRTGVHTSTILADLREGIRITLFKSGILHAGEFLDELLAHRDAGLPPPLHMSDGSSCNPATVTETIECNCNAHGFRKLEEKQSLYPEHWDVVGSVYRDVKKNETHIQNLKMDDDARLAYHRSHSKPRMNEMFDWMQRELDQKNVEPNSILGGIFQYFLTRKQKLMAFTEYVGAPITSNAVEQAIKLVALHRKNAMFFMTLRGAWISDVIMSVGATAGACEVNLYDYFVAILRYRDEVKKDPAAFLPWEYQKTVARLKETQANNPLQVCELTAEQWHERQASFAATRIAMRQSRLRKAA
jgi:transposase